MSNSVEWPSTIVIVGAPRSGTSLVQRIIRGCDGFATVAKESGFIWRRYTHPSRHDWYGETWNQDDIDAAECERIQKRFARYALPSSVWRNVDRHNVLRYQRVPLLSAMLRPAYHALAGLRAMTYRLPAGTRLVDKSVHNGLWLGLVERVFDAPLYLHVVREPRKSVESMAAGWRNPDRFFTYTVPDRLDIPDYPYRRWNFALPPGWRAFLNQPIEKISAYQWASIQEGILQFASAIPQERYLRIRLEDLTHSPSDALPQICRWGRIPFDAYLRSLAEELPVVNARGEGSLPVSDSRAAACLEPYSELVGRLGY